MRNFKTFLILGSLSAAMAGLAGCETWRHHAEGERSEGRMVDDAKITHMVKSDLNREPVFKFGDVDVRTFNGVVQLSGFVNTEEQKQRAAEVAQQVPQVAEVLNSVSL